MSYIRPAQLLDPAVGPHPLGVVERAVAVGLLLRDHDDLEVVEAQRHVEPPEPAATARRRRRCGRARRRRRPGGCPTTGRGCRATSTARPRCVVPPTRTSPRPRAHLREARALQDGAVAVADDVRLLLDRRERALPREVEADAVVVAVAHQAQLLQRLEHLDAVRARPAGACGRGRARRRSARCAPRRRASRWRRRRSRRGSRTMPSPVIRNTSPVRSWALK